VPKITFKIGASAVEVGGKIPKTYGAYLPQECLDKPLPARNVCKEKPEITSRDGARHVDARGGESAQGVGRAGYYGGRKSLC
jgi:hypothetical protein